jgi:hypothetical protein
MQGVVASLLDLVGRAASDWCGDLFRLSNGSRESAMGHSNSPRARGEVDHVTSIITFAAKLTRKHELVIYLGSVLHQESISCLNVKMIKSGTNFKLPTRPEDLTLGFERSSSDMSGVSVRVYSQMLRVLDIQTP